MDDWAVRVRTILTHAEMDRPGVTRAALVQYWRHLVDHLELPFSGDYRDGTTTCFVMVHGLFHPDRFDADELSGLICDARQENRPMAVPLAKVHVAAGHANWQLMEDYACWLGSRSPACRAR